MLRAPRRLPQRYNRRATSSTRRFIKRRHQRRRRYIFERWKRVWQRFQRKFASLRISLVRWLGVLVAGGVMLFVGLLLFSPLLDLQQIQVPRSDARIDQEQVIRAMAPFFGQHLFFVSGQEVQSLLKEAVPDLQSVSIEKRYPSSLALRLTMDPIIARLSIEDPSGQSPAAGSGAAAETADYLTAQGLYVSYFPSQVRDAPSLPVIRVLDWGARPMAYAVLVDPAFLLSLKEAEQALQEQFGQETVERKIFLRAQEFHLKTQNFELWFDRRTSLEDHFRRYRLFLQTVGVEGAKQYVDLRLGDKVIYK